ncbi:MAG: hypothetical protein R3C18_08280 [Planctomycetaceae bacterium]
MRSLFTKFGNAGVESGKCRSALRSKLALAAGLLLSSLLTGCGGVTQEDHDRAAAEIAVDLLGESVWTGQSAWTFAGPEEFENVHIVSVNGDENETRFIVDMDLIDKYSYEKWSMRASVDYAHWGNSEDWMLSSVNCIHWSKRF